MEWKLEVVPVPVANVDRAKAFYAEQLGFAVDLDIVIGKDKRVVQLTPPGSGCSIHISDSEQSIPPGALQGLQLVVSDIYAAQRHLQASNVKVSPVRHMADGDWVDGHGGDWNAFVFFADPDGNGWIVQEQPGGGAG